MTEVADLKPMILTIDYGGATAKVLKVNDAGSSQLIEFPLGFKTRPRLNIADSLRSIIKNAAGGVKPAAVYASGEIASVELKDILTEPPRDPVEVLNSLALPLLDVGVSFTYAGGQVFRGQIEPSEVAFFLPFDARPAEVSNFLGNKNLYPPLLPTTMRELQMEQAIAKAKIKSAIRHQPPSTPNHSVIATGGVFSKSPEAWQVVAIILDALEPEGLLDIYLDQEQILPAIGTLLNFDQETGQKLLLRHSPTLLAATLSTGGEVELELDLGLAESPQITIAAGNIEIVPLQEEKQARIRFKSEKTAGELAVRGGRIGLVVDTRPRPLNLPRDDRQRQRLLQRFAQSLSEETKKI